MDLAEREFIGVQFLDVKIAPGRGSWGAVDGIIAVQRRSARVVGADVGTLGVVGGGVCHGDTFVTATVKLLVWTTETNHVIISRSVQFDALREKRVSL